MSDKTTVEFLFDFGSPNAYLRHRVIPGIETRTATSRLPMAAFAPIQNKMDYDAHGITRFVKRYEITDFGMIDPAGIDDVVIGACMGAGGLFEVN
ncbi:hypothetical protein [Sphingobium chlorophenolicum]|uniref:2-hydroxychromene-2-carboxylate isomerase n=1 Tax=Sphingobium chlorophenolicum TaxID=46429 RepID=A0A081RBV5_SPHCR|nr:hypothetical protein [Sphingobium chlorophenolicum]KEQ52678.1 hypothetical protein BV95_03039 [Sphingobium chlorophenolicum]